MKATAAALAALSELYADLEREQAKASPRCDLKGDCCDFDRTDHVLFATGLELAYARRSGGDRPLPDAQEQHCPFFRAGRCHLRAGRPLGCRVYFCDPSYADRMRELAERYHRRVVAIHEQHKIPYRYRRFVQAIREPEAPPA
jgi:Fe-S-cluster containining protein